MIKAIIFDYYGVLTTDSYVTWLQRHPHVDADHPTEIDELSQAQDQGLSNAEFFDRLAKISGINAAEVQAGFDIHHEAHGWLINYIRHLRRKGLKTAILSNAPVSLYQEIAGHHWQRLFDLILCSEEAGVAKPDPKIYQLALDRLGVAPHEAIFVDDRDYNVRGAEAAGLEGTIYTGLPDFRAELIRRGIDTAQK